MVTDSSHTLSKAVTRSAECLGISRTLLAKVLRLSPATVMRLYSGEYTLGQRSKEWEFALLFVLVFCSLGSIVGDEVTVRKWMNSENRELNGKPIDLICETEGLVLVIRYLDASRGLI